MPDPDIIAEARRLLAAAGVTQYDLVKAGIGTMTARKLLGKAPGKLAADQVDRALALVGKRLWHGRRP